MEWKLGRVGGATSRRGCLSWASLARALKRQLGASERAGARERGGESESGERAAGRRRRRLHCASLSVDTLFRLGRARCPATCGLAARGLCAQASASLRKASGPSEQSSSGGACPSTRASASAHLASRRLVGRRGGSECWSWSGRARNRAALSAA